MDMLNLSILMHHFPVTFGQKKEWRPVRSNVEQISDTMNLRHGREEAIQVSSEEISESQLEEAIETLCRSKAEEFRLVGYEHVTSKDIWICVSAKYEKEGIPPLYKLVNDILSLKVLNFMNFMTISAYKGSTFD